MNKHSIRHARHVAVVVASITQTVCYLEDLKAGNIEYADEILSLVLRLKSLVTASDQPQEHPRVDSFGESRYRVDDLQEKMNHARVSRINSLSQNYCDAIPYDTINSLTF